MGKLPSFQFYPGDWMKDPELRAVSLSGRGLWIDMLCLMFEATPRGHLVINGKPVSVEQLARMVGSTADEVSRLIDELTASGVISVTASGVVYSRRMVRDDEIRAIRSKCGKKGGNPLLLKQNGVCLTHSQPKVQAKRKQNGKQNPTPSSSSSSSEFNLPPPRACEAAFPQFGPPGFDPAETAFLAAWNVTPGAIPCKIMSHLERNAFHERRQDPAWEPRVAEVLKKFPLKFWLKNGGVGLTKFLEPQFVDYAFGGRYDRDYDDSIRSSKPDRSRIGCVEARPGQFDHLG